MNASPGALVPRPPRKRAAMLAFLRVPFLTGLGAGELSSLRSA
jgi:hypothetical protein